MKIVGAQRSSTKSKANELLGKLLSALDGTTIPRMSVMPDDADLLLQWGFKPTVALQSCIAQKKPYVIADLGYFDGSRGTYFSISINGFHGLSMMPAGIDALEARYHPDLKPWKEAGEFITVYGQLEGDQALRGVNMTEWMHQVAHESTQIFRKPARKRPHPRMLNPWEPSLPALADTFEDTHVAITWTSTVAVQALIAGVPTVTMHPASPAYPATPHLLVRETFARERWIHELSHRQYRLADRDDCVAAAEYITSAYGQAKHEATRGQLDKPTPYGG